MPDDFRIEINSASLEEKLRSLNADLQGKIMATALRKGALVYQEAVADAAPERTDEATGESTSLPPGALKHDVELSKVPNLPAYRVKFGKYTAHVAKWMDQGFNLTRATRAMRRGKNRIVSRKVLKFISPRSLGFFRRAFEEASPEAEAAIAKEITEQVNKKWKSNV